MDTKKIGAFLKQCRKEKNLTQEQLAEKFGVSARTVSRWETGTNLPDLSILVELAEYYDVEMRELLDGERSQTMNKEMKETLDKVAVYEEWAKRKALSWKSCICINVYDWCCGNYYSDAIDSGYSLCFRRNNKRFSRRNPVCSYYGIQWNMG